MRNGNRLEWHLAWLQRLEAGALHDPTARPAFYPGWTVADVLAHVVDLHELAAEVVATGATERPSSQGSHRANHDVKRLVIELISHADRLHEALSTTTSASVWCLGAERPPSFWLRRMLSETVLHLWDVESGLGRVFTAPDASLANDCIDEFVDVRILRLLRRGSLEVEATATVALASDDGPAWTIDLGAGEVRPGCQAAESDVVRGAAADLWLWLNRRQPHGPVRQGPGDGPTGLERVLTSLRLATGQRSDEPGRG